MWTKWGFPPPLGHEPWTRGTESFRVAAYQTPQWASLTACGVPGGVVTTARISDPEQVLGAESVRVTKTPEALVPCVPEALETHSFFFFW